MAVAIVVAAGRGERLGHDRPKALVPLRGRPLLAWSLEALVAVRPLRRIVVVLPAGATLPADPADWGLPAGSWDDPGGGSAPRVIGVPGGAERSHSVRAGLAACGDGPPQEPVLVHDGARPMVTGELIRACLLGVAAGADAAIAAAPMTDTVKEARPAAAGDGSGSDGARPAAAGDGSVSDGAAGETAGGRAPRAAGSSLARVARTLDRSRLWAVQTPQVFRRDVLGRALAEPDEVLAAATDDASLVEAAGGDVRLVPAPRSNLKITVPEDLELAELLLAALRKNDVSC